MRDKLINVDVWGEMILAGGMGSRRKKTSFRAILSSTYPTWTGQGSKPMLRFEISATNILLRSSLNVKQIEILRIKKHNYVFEFERMRQGFVYL